MRRRGAGARTTAPLRRFDGRADGARCSPVRPCVAPRGIQPFHCPNDGDILYAVSTHEVPLDADTDVQLLGTLASEVCYDAILSIVA